MRHEKRYSKHCEECGVFFQTNDIRRVICYSDKCGVEKKERERIRLAKRNAARQAERSNIDPRLDPWLQARWTDRKQPWRAGGAYV